MADDATARNIVDLAMDDKPNAAGEVMNDVLLDKIGDKVEAMKTAISNDMFGQEIQPDAEPVEVDPEVDLEPVEVEEPEQEESEETYEADQETIEEPADEVEADVEEQPEESEEEKEEQ